MVFIIDKHVLPILVYCFVSLNSPVLIKKQISSQICNYYLTDPLISVLIGRIILRNLLYFLRISLILSKKKVYIFIIQIMVIYCSTSNLNFPTKKQYTLLFRSIIWVTCTLQPILIKGHVMHTNVLPSVLSEINLMTWSAFQICRVVFFIYHIVKPDKEKDESSLGQTYNLS